MKKYAVILGVLLGLCGPYSFAMADSVALTLRSANGSRIQNVFSERPDLGSAPELKYFPEPRKTFDFTEEEQQEQLADKSKKSEATDPRSLAEQRKPLSSKQDIIEAFGDPSESQPVLAQADAPAPFQAMMQAMNIGDQELAFAYARKYVRYVQGIRENNRDVVGFIAKAYEREGVEDGEGWTGSPAFDKYNAILEQDIAREKAETENQSLLEGLDDQTRALLEKAEALELQNQAGVNTKNSANKEADVFGEAETPARLLETQADARAKIRRQLVGKVPFSFDGRVRVTLYFKPKDRSSQMLGRELQKLQKVFSDDPRVSIEARVVGSALLSEVEYFRKKTGASYSIDISGMFSGSNANVSVPSLEFRVEKSGETFSQNGLRGFLFMYEVVKMMQGGV